MTTTQTTTTVATSTDDHEVTMLRANATANPTIIPPQFQGDVEKYVNSFKETRAALTRAQQELAQLRSGQKTETTEQVVESKPGDLESLVIPDAPKEAKKLPMDKIREDLATKGAISPELRKTLLEEHGIDDEAIDAFESGVKAQQVLTAQQAAQLVGGMDALKAITAWAAKSLTPAEKGPINEALANPATRGVTLMGLKARMDAAQVTNEPTYTPGVVTQTSGTGGAPFASVAEQLEAMRDKRYGKDDAYTQSVYARSQNIPKK